MIFTIPDSGFAEPTQTETFLLSHVDAVFMTSTLEAYVLRFSTTSGYGRLCNPQPLDQQNPLEKPISSTRLPLSSCFPKPASLLKNKPVIQREFVSRGCGCCSLNRDNEIKRFSVTGRRITCKFFFMGLFKCLINTNSGDGWS